MFFDQRQAYQFSHLQTMMANLFQWGEVIKVEGARASIKLGDIETGPLPVVYGAVGADKAGIEPGQGDQAFLAVPFGDLNQAVILGFVHKTSDLPFGKEGFARKPHVIFEDGTSLVYDKETKTLELNLSPEGAALSIKVSGNVSIEAKTASLKANEVGVDCEKAEVSCQSISVKSEQAEIEGININVKGNTSFAGNVSFGGSVRSSSGSPLPIEGAVKIDGEITSSGLKVSGSVEAEDVKASGISLREHIHPVNVSQAITSPPQEGGA
ncbi:MAG: phage baseplate assembly protein V [Oligoflexus sp.]